MMPQYLVVDSAALVKNVPLWEYGETLFSVPDVIDEIRDKEARQRLQALPFPITMRQPQQHSIKFVNEFSKKTGDYASLSLADMKVLALTYELEVELQGSTGHLNTEPRRVITEGPATKANHTHHFNTPPEQCMMSEQCEEARPSPLRTTTTTTLINTTTTTTGASDHIITEQHMEALDTFLLHHSYITGYTPSTADLILHQALMDQYPQLCSSEPLSKGEGKDTSLPFMLPHLRRWVMHIAAVTREEENVFAMAGQTLREILRTFREEEEVKEEVEKCVLGEDTEADHILTHADDTGPGEEEEKETQETEADNEEENRTEVENDTREEGNENENEDENEDTDDGDDDDEGWITCKNIKKHRGKRNIFGGVEEEVEEKDVKVACITGDFAIQNVLKHIGLSVMGVDGGLIKRLKTYILRCHACFRTTSIMDKIFCPHCGNKTLKKVSVTLDPDGTQRIWINTKRPISKRGTKYSLPTPKGGKHGRNPILVADQREAKRFSSNMSKKKVNPLHEDYDPDHTPFAVRDVYSRAAQLGYIGGKNHHHFYWEKRNPNEPQRRTGKK